jgi:hypothetical protein
MKSTLYCAYTTGTGYWNDEKKVTKRVDSNWKPRYKLQWISRDWSHRDGGKDKAKVLEGCIIDRSLVLPGHSNKGLSQPNFPPSPPHYSIPRSPSHTRSVLLTCSNSSGTSSTTSGLYPGPRLRKVVCSIAGAFPRRFLRAVSEFFAASIRSRTEGHDGNHYSQDLDWSLGDETWSLDEIECF